MRPLAATGVVFMLSAALATQARANPVSPEVEPGFTAKGSAAEARFLGMQSVEAYNKLIRVQWQIAGAWVATATTWEAGETVKADNGSGLADFVMFRTSVGCPAIGQMGIRLAYYDEYYDEYSEWYKETVTCDAVMEGTGGETGATTSGDTSGGASTGTGGDPSTRGGCQCGAAHGGGVPMGMGIVLLFRRRRGPTRAAP